MLKILEPYILTFIPIFVAVDVLGNMPLFVSLTSDLTPKHRKKIIAEAVTTATVIALVFVLVGKGILRLLGITVSDFKIAGGILLLSISVTMLLNLLFPTSRSKITFKTKSGRDMGIFPLGTPIITGPAVLTISLMMVDNFGLIPTFVSLVINMFIVWIAFVHSNIVMHFLGRGGARAFSRIAEILLASIAVMMIRKGICDIFLSIR